MNGTLASASLLLAAALAAPAQSNAPLKAIVTIHADGVRKPVSPTLYGIFFEDINYAADGGLYAEMVQNRSFDYYATPGFGKDLTPTYAWEGVQRGARQAELKVQIASPFHPYNPNYGAVTIKGDTGEAGIVNTGYDGGMSVQAGALYDLSLYARWQGGDAAPLRVALETTNGTVLASAALPAPGANWSKHELTLAPSQTERKARLVITTATSGVLSLDMVSLFPRDTFKGRKNGLRKDLAQAIADLKPAILRFPGGCLVHGTGLDNAYRWKETVGDVTQRRAKWNRWGYHQTFGLGYFEYFQFCEDVGASPLPILPVGVSCGFAKPFEIAREEQLQEMIQDAIDLVEFANGSPGTKWGRVRTEMGHSRPFNLEYLGLGNEENDTATFRELFPRFVKALRRQHPEIKLVGTSGLGWQTPLFDLMERNGVDISDEHYYMPPEWFIENIGRFDRVERGRTKIFVGEYASNGNRQFNAVAEAAYLTGLERNSDLVVMGAYAPLLSRYNFSQWPRANLIWFDSDSVVLTPSYHVQRMFSTHLGDRYLSNTVQFAAGSNLDGKAPVLAVSPTLAEKSGLLFIKIANPQDVPVNVNFSLAGFAQVKPQAKCVQLAAPKDAANSREQPANVAPVTASLPVGSTFEVAMPATSVHVLTLQLN
jgi:alpha-L-arabinofuranosidase